MMQAYKKLITMSKEKLDELKANTRAKEMKAKATMEISQLEGQILEKQAAIENLGSAYPINFSKLLDEIEELQLLELRKSKFEELVAALFPEDEA